MSRISFGGLTADDAEVDAVLQRLAAWVEEKPEERKIIDPRERARAWRDVSAETLTAALGLLVKQKRIRRVYMVETDGGVFAEEEFERPTDVTDEVEGRFGEKIDTAEAKIVPVFRRVE